MKMTAWTYQNEPVTEEDTLNHYGFVYQITNNVTGRKYIGRKYFTKAGYKIIKGKRRKIRKPSDWVDYWGSNGSLKKDVGDLGAMRFSREVLRFCKNRSECSYWETHYIIENQALLRDDYYNEWLSVKVSKKNLVKA
jgi:hypothetical protein